MIPYILYSFFIFVYLILYSQNLHLCFWFLLRTWEAHSSFSIIRPSHVFFLLPLHANEPKLHSLSRLPPLALVLKLQPTHLTTPLPPSSPISGQAPSLREPFPFMCLASILPTADCHWAISTPTTSPSFARRTSHWKSSQRTTTAPPSSQARFASTTIAHHQQHVPHYGRASLDTPSSSHTTPSSPSSPTKLAQPSFRRLPCRLSPELF